MARMSAGKDSTMSMRRMRTLSEQAAREAGDRADEGPEEDGEADHDGPMGSDRRAP